MNHLLAKIKGANGGLFKVLSNQSVFDQLEDFENRVEYQPDYKLEADEWFSISQFSEKPYCPDLLRKQFIATDFNQIQLADYVNINYLISIENGFFYFQKLTAKQLIQKKYFTISQAPTIVEDQKIIIIDSFPDAIYKTADDTLYFRRLSSLTTIFKGIDTLFREATQEETETFLSSDFIQLTQQFSADKVKQANRKRITMAMETIATFQPQVRKNIFQYIKDYCKDLSYDENEENFAISSEGELKQLLWGIDQRYYTTPFGNERRLANSVIAIGTNTSQ
jgi:hypothetical protein